MSDNNAGLTITVAHQDDAEEGAYYIPGEGESRLAEMTYIYTPEGDIIIDHTEVAPALRGQGVGATLLGEVVRMARRKGIKIMATCSYAKDQLEKREQYEDVYISGEEE